MKCLYLDKVGRQHHYPLTRFQENNQKLVSDGVLVSTPAGVLPIIFLYMDLF